MIEFIEETHQYLIDGMLVPSVSQILHFIFPDKYKNVNKEILNAKAKYGSTLHEYIEKYEKSETKQLPKIDYIQESSFKQYLKLKDKYKLEVLEQEKMVVWKNLYAGRYDMIAEVNGNKCLCDIKTTAECDMEYLSWQLSLYELASGQKFEKLYVIWLPKKELGQLLEIERKPKEELIQKINEYFKRED